MHVCVSHHASLHLDAGSISKSQRRGSNTDAWRCFGAGRPCGHHGHRDWKSEAAGCPRPPQGSLPLPLPLPPPSSFYQEANLTERTSLQIGKVYIPTLSCNETMPCWDNSIDRWFDFPRDVSAGFTTTPSGVRIKDLPPRSGEPKASTTIPRIPNPRPHAPSCRRMSQRVRVRQEMKKEMGRETEVEREADRERREGWRGGEHFFPRCLAPSRLLPQHSRILSIPRRYPTRQRAQTMSRSFLLHTWLEGRLMPKSRLFTTPRTAKESITTSRCAPNPPQHAHTSKTIQPATPVVLCQNSPCTILTTLTADLRSDHLHTDKRGISADLRSGFCRFAVAESRSSAIPNGLRANQRGQVQSDPWPIARPRGHADRFKVGPPLLHSAHGVSMQWPSHTTHRVNHPISNQNASR